MAENFGEKSVVLEGMYKGVANKIDEINQSLLKELQYGSQQQMSSYEGLSAAMQQNTETVLNELRYIAQQNSSIYEYGKKEREAEEQALISAVQEAIASTPIQSGADPQLLEAISERVDRLTQAMSEQTEALLKAFTVALDERTDKLTQAFAEQLAQANEAAAEQWNARVDKLSAELRREVALQIRDEMRKLDYVPSEESETFEERTDYETFESTFDYSTLAEKIASIMPETDYDMIADKVIAALPQTDENAFVDKVVAALPQTDENAIADRVAEAVPLTDYDLIAEKVAGVLQHEFDITVDETGVSRIAAQVVEALDYEQISAKVVELMKAAEPETEEEPVQETLALGSEEFAQRVAEKVVEYLTPEETEETEEAEEEIPVEEAQEENSEEPFYSEEFIQNVAERLAAYLKEGKTEEPEAEEGEEKKELVFDEESAQLLASKLADYMQPAAQENSGLAAIDTDAFAESVAAKVADYFAAAGDTEAEGEQAVSEEEYQEEASEEATEEAQENYEEEYSERIATRVAELIKEQTEETATATAPFDSDELVERISERLKSEDIAREVSEYLNAEEFAKKVAEYLKQEIAFVAAVSQAVQSSTVRQQEPAESLGLYEQTEPEPEPEPELESEPVSEEYEEEYEEETEEEDEDEDEPKAKRKAKSVRLPKPKAEPEMTMRYKRSFTAKIIESEEDVKEFYSEMKNTLLSYARVGSQVNWSNDRFTYHRETIAKICLRGKTLCLYLALNPDEFPTTVYHQKYAGDTKMYEKTPMMVKIKSEVALKRAIRLIELLMEHYQAVKEETERVDYAAQYAFRSEQDLINAGLIKMSLVEKSDMDF